MFEAYKNSRRLRELETQLPNDAADVKQTLLESLKSEPANSRTLLVLARCYLLCEEPDEAKHTLETLISQDAGNVSAKVELAKILFNENDAHSAAELLVDATNTRPEIDENWLLLSEYLQTDGQEQASKNALIQYDMIKAFNDNLGMAEQAFANGEFVRADKLCRQLLGQVPAEVRTLRLLARLAKRFHHFEISTSVLAQCIDTQPGNAALGLEYAYSLLANKKHKEALEQCHRLIGLAPENIDIYDVKAGALVALGKYEEAITIYRELLKVHDKQALCLLRLGNVLKTVGETEEAIDCYRQAVVIEPSLGEAFWNLANLKTYQFSADEINSMQQFIQANETLAMNRVLMQFALGKAMEDAQQFAKSFQYYQSANNAYTKIRPFRYSNRNSSLKSFFTAEYFSGRKESGNNSNSPIFIVGLPRSGSTLVEQILSNHSLVDATMELTEIITIARELNDPNHQGAGQYPQSMEGLSENQIKDLAQRYLDYAKTFRQQAPYFIDKQPGNFHHIGLIKTLLPNAKIIDVRRDPMASGWSLYKHFFAEGNQYSYELATIGKYYSDYVELMKHWHTVLPKQLLTISYEDLINDLSNTLDSILQYCGLEFEEACLNHHLNKRAVATASSEQVRQPLYKSSLEQWKNYDEFLEPLKQNIRQYDFSPAS